MSCLPHTEPVVRAEIQFPVFHLVREPWDNNTSSITSVWVNSRSPVTFYVVIFHWIVFNQLSERLLIRPLVETVLFRLWLLQLVSVCENALLPHSIRPSNLDACHLGEVLAKRVIRTMDCSHSWSLALKLSVFSSVNRPMWSISAELES